eukprot:m.177446 g.177446  ORF g.177446 m.177446 type:complete len:685 (-) comp18367_c0_seq2:175-2229(-)
MMYTPFSAIVLALSICVATAVTRDIIALDLFQADGGFSGPPPPPPPAVLAFSPVYGSNMLLERAPAKAAAYGTLGEGGTAVAVTVSGEGTSYTVNAVINDTYQPEGYVNPDGTPYPVVPSWKALLKPTAAGGNYTITATCTGCTGTTNVTITNVTFGDMWYCTGQSNMWLPVLNSFSRNDSVKAIVAGKYSNIRGMFGPSASTNTGGKTWMSAPQAIADGTVDKPSYSLFNMGATCWYFAQRLVDEGITTPIGIADTAIGGQRIEEFIVNTTEFMYSCDGRMGATSPVWNGQLFAEQVAPFVDMTVHGWVWYQGENNMQGIKGNSIAKIGYSCEQKALIEGYRAVWSKSLGTTDPHAPFGVVTLASSGSEGAGGMGPMRQAQTAGYGILPNKDMPNTFLAQAYDLDDEWLSFAPQGPCYEFGFNRTSPHHQCCGKGQNMTACTSEWQAKCKPACDSMANTQSHGSIHPRSKKQVGDRLGTAAYNTVYGGTKAYTGPTLAGCTVSATTLTIAFDASLLRGDKVVLQQYNAPVFTPYYRGVAPPLNHGGSQLYVQTNASNFCMETYVNPANTSGPRYCPTWAGGPGPKSAGNADLDQGWINLPITSATATGITVDLTPLNGSAPTAVRYAWGITDCCDLMDPELYVSHGCVANCPIMSSSGLPANPFQAQIVGGKCKCVAPQVCDA